MKYLLDTNALIGLLFNPDILSKDACVKLAIGFLPIISKHIDRMRELPLIHRDPFDRIIIAQALIEEMILITKDSIIPQYGEVITVW